MTVADAQAIGLPSAVERVLLLNPPIYDTRVPWARWQQPSILLRLATHFRRLGADVRLIDALHVNGGERLRRQRIRSFDLDGVPVHTWRFGLPRPSLDGLLQELARAGWLPDRVYVECFTTFWWEGAAEVVSLVRDRFPHAHVTLVGAYARLASAHAQTHVEPDEIMAAFPEALADLSPDLSLYSVPPPCAHVCLNGGGRGAEEVVDEIAELAGRGVREFAFTDQGSITRSPEHFGRVLKLMLQKRLKVRLYALGNVAASELAAAPDLASLMKRAGYAQICFADDRGTGIDGGDDDELLDHYRLAVVRCHEAGYRPRTDALVASVSLGRPGEDLAEQTRFMTLLAHEVGSVIVWPYQPAPQECSEDLPLEMQNGKLFPFRAENGVTYRDYLDVMGLGAVLNAKYRTRTFDFLGDGLIPRLLRESMERRGWDPPEEVKGSLRLPLVERHERPAS